jgi:hypothetical protein
MNKRFKVGDRVIRLYNDNGTTVYEIIKWEPKYKLGYIQLFNAPDAEKYLVHDYDITLAPLSSLSASKKYSADEKVDLVTELGSLINGVEIYGTISVEGNADDIPINKLESLLDGLTTKSDKEVFADYFTNTDMDDVDEDGNYNGTDFDENDNYQGALDVKMTYAFDVAGEGSVYDEFSYDLVDLEWKDGNIVNDENTEASDRVEELIEKLVPKYYDIDSLVDELKHQGVKVKESSRKYSDDNPMYRVTRDTENIALENLEDYLPLGDPIDNGRGFFDMYWHLPFELSESEEKENSDLFIIQGDFWSIIGTFEVIEVGKTYGYLNIIFDSDTTEISYEDLKNIKSDLREAVTYMRQRKSMLEAKHYKSSSRKYSRNEQYGGLIGGLTYQDFEEAWHSLDGDGALDSIGNEDQSVKDAVDSEYNIKSVLWNPSTDDELYIAIVDNDKICVVGDVYGPWGKCMSFGNWQEYVKAINMEDEIDEDDEFIERVSSKKYSECKKSESDKDAKVIYGDKKDKKELTVSHLIKRLQASKDPSSLKFAKALEVLASKAR